MEQEEEDHLGFLGGQQVSPVPDSHSSAILLLIACDISSEYRHKFQIVSNLSIFLMFLVVWQWFAVSNYVHKINQKKH